MDGVDSRYPLGFYDYLSTCGANNNAAQALLCAFRCAEFKEMILPGDDRSLFQFLKDTFVGDPLYIEVKIEQFFCK